MKPVVWAFEAKSTQSNDAMVNNYVSLNPNRECELALQNYNLRREKIELERINFELKGKLKRVKLALQNSSAIVDEFQRRFSETNKSFLQANKLIDDLREENLSISKSNKHLSSTYSKYRDKCKLLKEELAQINLNHEAFKNSKQSMELEKDSIIHQLEGNIETITERSILEKLEMQSKYDNQSCEVSQLELSMQKYKDEINQLQLLIVEKENLADHYRMHVEQSAPYKALHDEYDVAIQQLQEMSIDRDRYRKKAEVLAQENDRIVSFALCEGLQVPPASSCSSSFSSF